MRRHKMRSRLTQIVMVFAVLCASTLGINAPVQAQGAGPNFSYSIAFLPSTVKRLCVGDSATFRFMVKLNDLDPSGQLAPLAPLTARQISITTNVGTATPVLFSLLGGYGVFQFKYTADSPGDETITVQMVEDQGSASKSFKVFEACDYEVTFFASTEEQVETGGYNVEFWGAGDLGLARRNDTSDLTLQGDGNDAASLLIIAFVESAFSCTMTPFSANSTFSMKGSLLPESDQVQFGMEFKPMTFPGTMNFACDAVGLGTFTMSIPIGEQTGDANDLDLKDITVGASGGTYRFAFGKSTGIVTVRKAAQ
jgi:hypothetical protein